MAEEKEKMKKSNDELSSAMVQLGEIPTLRAEVHKLNSKQQTIIDHLHESQKEVESEMDKANAEKEQREHVARQLDTTKEELSETKARLTKMENDLKATRAENHEADSAAHQLKEKLESVEKKLFISKQGRKQAVTMLGQTAVGDQSTSRRVEVVDSKLIEQISI